MDASQRVWVATLLLAALVLSASAVAAQQPAVSNAQVQQRSAATGLEREFRAIVAAQSAPAWIGYAVPLVPGQHRYSCCTTSDACCGACGLEARSGAYFQNDEPKGVKLEGAKFSVVLFRVEQKTVGKIRSFTEDCNLDAGGLPFLWLNDVRPAESVALLTTFAAAADDGVKETRRLSDAAVSAIAMHADAAADAAVERFAAAAQPTRLREQAIFWLGAARGRRGYEIVRRIAREDPDERIRDKAVFALSVSKEPGAVDAIIAVARDDKSSRVRGQALFWLAQKAGQKAAGVISETIERDPETEVKKRAVFALSQLPKDEGVPLLIQVARTNKNPVVRKQAVFWLGQSKDPRALQFFEEVLRR
jgi:hypothetical protein